MQPRWGGASTRGGLSVRLSPAFESALGSFRKKRTPPRAQSTRSTPARGVRLEKSRYVVENSLRSTDGPTGSYYKGVRIGAGVLVFFAIAISACSRRGTIELGRQLAGGDPKIGEHLIYTYGCGSCHVIPGVAEANGAIGPTLRGFGSRTYIAGLLTNTPRNLSRWISKPQEIDPANAMPDLGVTEHQARDIAAYLYTLR